MIRSITCLRAGLLPALGLALAAACVAQDATSVEPAEVAVSAGGVSIDVVTTNAWDTGFNGAVRLTNNAFPAPITSFEVVFRLGGSVTVGNAWNGEISAPSASGDRTARNPSWLPPIATGTTWEVGFNGGGAFAGSTIAGVRINNQTIAIGAPTPPAPTPTPTPTPAPGPAAGYSTGNGKLFKDGVEIKLFGLNWFGLETSDRVLHGLWTGRQISDFLADIKSKGFTALRLPVSPQTINPGFPISVAGPSAGADLAALAGKDGRAALEHTLTRAQAAGLFVLLDFHTCNPAQLGSSLPGSPIACPGYSLDRWLADIRTLATLSRRFGNVVGIDLTNEPHLLTWSAWANLASQAGQAALAVNPNITIWVEGVGNESNTGGNAVNWGGNLFEAGAIPGIPANRLVFSPHAYGPSVALHSYFSAPGYPANMPAIWDAHFGRLVGRGFTVIPGEYGGHYTTNANPALNDKLWQDSFVTYLLNKGMTSNFYWTVNPNSGDTGGVYLDDWQTFNNAKILLLQRLMR